MSQKPVEVRVPPLGESITSAVVGRWLAKSGQKAEEGDTLAELETDKVTLEIPAPVAGKLEILKSQGEEVRPGEVLARLTGAGRSAASVRDPETGRSKTPEALRKAENPPEPEKAEAEALREAAPRREEKPDFRPVRYEAALEEPAFSSPLPKPVAAPGERREPLSPLRLAIARNLRASQEEAAVLTTFNEVNMAEVQAIRARYKEKFARRHQGTRLGLMSFFARAVVEALEEFPLLNARIEGSEIVHPASVNLGIAVGTDRGLVVPVIHGAESMGFAQLEEKIADFGARAKTGRLHLEELAGGSFTITNGGVFGSLLSTPLLNGRQSGVLGLHGIVDRPIARDGQVVIAPMMYIALSYDHRLVDGREAVTFLRRVKEFVEDPARLLLEV